uniref:Putative radical SAM superfamily protein n=1 Tax=viral metagenome TaxID=1070528 RepID=A0A6H1ZIZ4_9ZZZZ
MKHMRPDLTLIFPKSEFLLDQAVFPPLGILYISAYLKQQGLNVQCLDMGIGHTPDMAESENIGISFTTPQRQEAFSLARRYGAMGEGRIVIGGGPHPTHMPDECEGNGFTFTSQGRGELFLHNFFGYWTGKFVALGIDDYPFPDRDALPIKEYHYEIDGVPATPIMTSRGCFANCAFCAKIDNNFQMQSAGRTIAEIEHIHEKYGYEAFMIFDDVFVASKKRLQAIVNGIGDAFKFRCFARSNLLDDKVCKLLRQLGVVEVGIGIESGSDDILSRNMKGTTRKQNTRAVRRLHDNGIRAKAFLIVGLPGESNGTVIETADWITEAEPDDIDLSVFQPMPGSKIFAEPEKWGIQFEYDGKPGWYKGRPGEYEPTANTEHLTGAEILEWRDLLEREFKRPELLR